jgi:hypothetical protein
VVRVNGVQAAVDFCRDGPGAAGRGHVDDFRAVALAYVCVVQIFTNEIISLTARSISWIKI